MTSPTLRTDVELLTYANAVRRRTGHGLSITIIAALFIAWAIIDAFTSATAIVFGS